jgi:hypothetical protein
LSSCYFSTSTTFTCPTTRSCLSNTVSLVVDDSWTKATPMSFRITMLHAYTQIDQANREGVIGVRLGEAWYPLVAETAGAPSVAIATSIDAQARLTELGDENEQLRKALAYEARVVQAHYEGDKRFPKSRRAVAEEQVERMRRVAVGDPFREYAGIAYLERYYEHARALLSNRPIETLPIRLVHQGEPDVAQPPRNPDGRRR